MSNLIKSVFTPQTCTMHHNIDNLWFSIPQKTVWKPTYACMLCEYYSFGHRIRYWVRQLMCMSWIHWDKVSFFGFIQWAKFILSHCNKVNCNNCMQLCSHVRRTNNSYLTCEYVDYMVKILVCKRCLTFLISTVSQNICF